LSDHARRLAKAESALALGRAGGRAPLQLILVRGGLPTLSGKPECLLGDNVLTPAPGEDLEDYIERVRAAAARRGAGQAVITGLPSREQGPGRWSDREDQGQDAPSADSDGAGAS
jgi:hypothetical protein